MCFVKGLLQNFRHFQVSRSSVLSVETVFEGLVSQQWQHCTASVAMITAAR